MKFLEIFWREDLFRDTYLCKEAGISSNYEHSHAGSFLLWERSPATCFLAQWVFYSDCARVQVRLPMQSGWSWSRHRPGCVWGMLAHQPDPSPMLFNSQSSSRSCGKAVLQSVVADKVLISPVFLGTPAGWAHRKCVWVIYACGIFMQLWESPANQALISSSPETAPNLWASQELNLLLFGKMSVSALRSSKQSFEGWLLKKSER